MTAKYSMSSHTNDVTEHAIDTGIYGATLDILRVLCQFSNHKKPIVQLTQKTMAKKANRNIKTVHRAIRTLREAGVIIAVKYPRGGRGQDCATVFKLIGKTAHYFEEEKQPEKLTKTDSTPITSIEFSRAITKGGTYARGMAILNEKYPEGFHLKNVND